MLSEKDFEDIICQYPELIEEHLILEGRQVTLFGRRMDLLFEDRFKRKLIIELKIGPIKDEHIGQILSYEGMLLSAEEPTIRIMLVGNRVPPNIQRSLDHHGIAWKEITLSRIKELLREKNDNEFLGLFDDEYKPVNLEEKKKVYSSISTAKKESSEVETIVELKINSLYTRKNIHEILGGSLENYLPHVNGRVVCGCFDLKLNPNAPEEILVGNGRDIIKYAKVLSQQIKPIPVFLKRAVNDWEYVGDYNSTGYSEEPFKTFFKSKGSRACKRWTFKSYRYTLSAKSLPINKDAFNLHLLGKKSLSCYNFSSSFALSTADAASGA